jgi:GT2 family glycosyltransferase
MENCGIVVIGRNEAQRLHDCFQAIMPSGCKIVFADSASTDDSVQIAKQYQINIVELDASLPLSAARGRNAGAKKLLEIDPFITLIQFVDGDTILDTHWLEKADKIMRERPDVAVLDGILKEKNSSISLFKHLSALEWECPPGHISFTGGNCMMRVKVFLECQGFNEKIQAAEDTELCCRIRQKGGIILHSHELMGIHDSRIFNFKQFCNRCAIKGYSCQQISSMYVNQPEKLLLRENLSNWFYGGIIPISSLVLSPLTSGLSLLLFLIYPVLFVRIYVGARKNWKPWSSFAYASSCIIGKFPSFFGACKYLFSKPPPES